MLNIKSVIRKIIICVRNSVKVISIATFAILLIVAIVTFIYKPTYSVTLNGEFVGYSNNKSELQAKINQYIENGDGTNANVSFVEMDALPQYRLCFLKKKVEFNDEEIFEKVKSTGTVYYKYYSIIENGEEKIYVGTFAEAEEIINGLKEKNSTNIEKLSISEKYEKDLKTFTSKEEAVSSLYVAPVKKVTVAKKTTTKKTNTRVAAVSSEIGNQKMSSLGVSFINPTSGIISSRYGRRWNRSHNGIDVAASTGTPIYAAASGKVTYSGYNSGGYGYLVKMTHGNGVETYYGHCSQLLVSSGATVSQGQLIAKVGSTGRSTGPHLHFEIRLNGTPQNPLNYVY